MQMGMFTKGVGKMGRQVGMAYLFITPEVVMKDTGKMIWSTGSGHNAGPTATSMKDFIQEAKRTAKVIIVGVTAATLRGIGWITKLQVTEFTCGATIGGTKATGCRTKCMGVGCTTGARVENTRVSIKTIRNMASDLTHGRMDVDILENGRITREMGVGSCYRSMGMSERGSGKTIGGSSGWTKALLLNEYLI